MDKQQWKAEAADLFSTGSIFETDNFEDPEHINHPCYGHYKVGAAFQEFIERFAHDMEEQSEMMLAEIIDRMYLAHLNNFVDYKEKTHKLGWFKEKVKEEFHERLSQQ